MDDTVMLKTQSTLLFCSLLSFAKSRLAETIPSVKSDNNNKHYYKYFQFHVINPSSPVSDLAHFQQTFTEDVTPLDPYPVPFHLRVLEIPIVFPHFCGAKRCRVKTRIEKRETCSRARPPAFNVKGCTHQCGTQTQLCTLEL